MTSFSTDDAALAMPSVAPNVCCTSSNESGSTWPTAGTIGRTDHAKRIKGISLWSLAMHIKLILHLSCGAGSLDNLIDFELSVCL